MKDMLILLAHLLTTIAKLLGPGGASAVVADSLLMKQQLLVINRSRRRAPNLSALDRFLLGFWSLFLNPCRIQRAAVIIRPSTLLKFHNLLKKRKYRLLYSSGSKGKPGPKGPSRELIQAIVELKQRNPRFGCPRIAQQINKAFGVDIDKDVVRRVLAAHYRPGDGVALCRMFNKAISTQGVPHYLSSDNDPLFRYQRWQANLRILDIDEIKSIPYTPCSHPFIERLIGTIRREYLDHILFWNVQDLERKLVDFRQYYNRDRVHQSLDGDTPDEVSGVHQPPHAKLSNYSWISHRNGLIQAPIAA